QRWRVFKDASCQRPVLEGQSVRDRRHQLDLDLRQQMADDLDVEGFGHGRDFEPTRDTTDAQQIDHQNVHRTQFEELAELPQSGAVLAGDHGGVECAGNACQAGVVFGCRRVLQPVQAERLEASRHLDRLVDAPELIDIAHQVNLIADHLAYDARP